MYVLVKSQFEQNPRRVDPPQGLNPVLVGREGGRAAVPLPGRLAAEVAAELKNDPDVYAGWLFVPHTPGWSRALPGGRRDPIQPGEGVPVVDRLVVDFHPHYRLTVEVDPADQDWEGQQQARLADRHHAAVDHLHHRVAEERRGPTLAEDAAAPAAGSLVHQTEELIDRLAGEMPELADADLANYLAGVAAKSTLLRLLTGDAAAPPAGDAWRTLSTRDDEAERQLGEVVSDLAGDVRRLAAAAADDRLRRLGRPDAAEAAADAARTDLSALTAAVGVHFPKLWRKAAPRLRPATRRYLTHRQLKKEVKEYLFGFGPLEDLLTDPGVTEVMANGPAAIFVEKNKVVENSGRRFISDDRLRDVAARIVSRCGRLLNDAEPIADAWLPDGSRVNAVIDPVAGAGTTLTIRRFPAKALTVRDLLHPKPDPDRNPHPLPSLSPDAVRFLAAAVGARWNILVAGGTGTGKTTLLNCLGEFIPNKERIVTIEDTAELRLSEGREVLDLSPPPPGGEAGRKPKAHVVPLLTRPKNMEGKGEIPIRALVKNALRMRPDRIVVGECRGGEAIDMLQAMNTGHDGSMTTVHANSPADVVLRLEVMAQQNPDIRLPVESIHRQITTAVDLVIQLGVVTSPATGPGGGVVKHRVVTEIAEVVDVKAGGGVRLRTLFDRDGNGPLEPTGRLPDRLTELVRDRRLDLSAFLGGARA